MTHAGDDIVLKPRPGMAARIANIQRLTGLTATDDLVNNALALLEWAAQEALEKGRSIASVDEANQHFTVLSMPVLTRKTVANDR